MKREVKKKKTMYEFRTEMDNGLFVQLSKVKIGNMRTGDEIAITITDDLECKEISTSIDKKTAVVLAKRLLNFSLKPNID